MKPGPVMRFQLDKESRTPIYDQVREQLISALHIGRLQAGAKLPSVRHFARVHGINPKTIHRIYRRLHEEGYLKLRPGSGAYIAHVPRGDLDGDRLLSLHRFFRTSLAECQRMGVNPTRAMRLFESFVTRDRLRTARIGLVECTREQVNLFTHEIRTALGVQVVPFLVHSLREPRAGAALKDLSFFVTTDFHMQEVSDFASSLQLQVLQVRLRPEFVPALMEAAQRGRLLMVVSSADGMESFLRATSVMGMSKEAMANIDIVGPEDPARIRQMGLRASTIYVSSLVKDRVNHLLPSGKTILSFDQHLSEQSMELIEAAVLFGGRNGNAI